MKPIGHAAAFLLSAFSLVVLAQNNPNELLLKDYKPRSIFKIPQTRIEKAKFPAIDVHTHVYATNAAGVQRWIKILDEVGIEKAVVLVSGAGDRFDKAVELYGKYPERFELWCGFDLTSYKEPDFPRKALAELERCKTLGAKGVGEITDKGRGLGGAPGMHLDDPRMDPIIKRCGELGLPINIHVGEDQWMYEPMDQHNDGLMNSYKWRIPREEGVLGHDEVLATLEKIVARHPGTTIIACHFANSCANLDHLGAMLDNYPNLYADMGARFAEIAPIPRYMGRFFDKYQDRLLYGTDNSFNAEMYRTSFRILESHDEHFYTDYFAKYHWPFHGFGLPENILKKVYRDNYLKLMKTAQSKATNSSRGG